jgi:magnesium transporter
METRILRLSRDGAVTLEPTVPEPDPATSWVWIDTLAAPEDADALVAFASDLALDPLSMRDAIDDFDLPKFDDFGHHLVVVLHGLRDDRIETYEIDCFMWDRYLLTVHGIASPALDRLWLAIQDTPQLARGGVDELLARIADVSTRRLLAVLDAFDDRVEELIEKALRADPNLVAELTAVRSDLAAARRIVHPQRETIDSLRHSTSPLISDAGRRRFSDVFDVASRTAQGLDAGRTALAEILDAYRGAEARIATDVTKVLTIYAAIMLPLSLVAGFFGMNFPNLPWINRDFGWIIVTAFMAAVAVLSFGVFIALGWLRRPSGRKAGAALGRGLIEAARAPAQIVGAVYEIGTMPLRATTRWSRNDQEPQADAQ